ncbi:hypothetical protein KVR01_012125 [Diaporthe batatas]|uniref:uncharacterized protein n=1 Tax=Diaporthe batatas TaxID=748121 RepID=UPI001D056BCA|nr:uncharacterized protein KVR01_012125 [Diaporthe batatas]KAG8158364.1 hypothetical protein KVR01_012125 [Diaporthe batatas]
MWPRSYDHVSEETRQTVQLFIARAGGFLQGRGRSDDNVNATVAKVMKNANREVLETAVAAWKRSRQLCTAEQLVQRFAGRVWKVVVSGEAVGVTEAEARGICQLKEQTPTWARNNPFTSFIQPVEHMNWPGAPLTADQFRLMDAGLMETIWETRIYRGDNKFHEAGPFAVVIPKDKAWLVLGEDFELVRTAILSRWWPLRLYTCDLGHNLLVGLWVPKPQFLGQPDSQEMVRCMIEELFNILRHWEFQVQGTGMQSLVACLAGYLVEVGAL